MWLWWVSGSKKVKGRKRGGKKTRKKDKYKKKKKKKKKEQKALVMETMGTKKKGRGRAVLRCTKTYWREKETWEQSLLFCPASRKVLKSVCLCN